MNDYQRFLESKKHSIGNFGFKANFIPDCAFDFQKYVIEKAVQKGRIAVFLDTGLGKTLVQLSIAKNIINHTNKKVLILTPLAVSFQFIKEAKDRNITDDIEISKNGKHTKKIVIANYERLHYFDEKDFECVILDESSILKNFDGKIKQSITSFIKKIPYRFLSTATPSPNDFIELGTSSEALGYMGYMDMLGKFFKNNQNDTGGRNNIGNKFYLKPHAEKDFFAWVNQWSIMAKMPSDLGFSNERYNLPKLIKNKHIVKNQSLIDVNGQIQMFTPIAKTMTEVRHEQKMTEEKRCLKAVELANNKTSVYWCNTNNESAILKELDKEAVEIIGSQSIDKKEERLLAFANGDIKRLITKAKMTGMGLNWQHCNHSVFFPTWSYEQYYQAVRRFWRFGQKNDVTIDMVISDGQTRVLEALEQKTQKAIELHKNLTKNVNSTFINNKKEFNKSILKPKFI
jgi:superfamily II DNA or RNA helicase